MVGQFRRADGLALLGGGMLGPHSDFPVALLTLRNRGQGLFQRAEAWRRAEGNF